MFVPQRLRVFQGFHRVQRFAGLRNGDDELLRVGNHVAVAVFAGDFHVARNAGNAFQPVFAGECGVIRCAACQNLDAVDIVKHGFGVCAEIFGNEAAVQKHFGGVGHGARLLVDFFLHEMVVCAQFQ